jgi:hypothetical protein
LFSTSGLGESSPQIPPLLPLCNLVTSAFKELSI